ncbi:MAG: acyl-CoA dehydrogenase family protein, partial [Deltaproteobacteria bacterium]|nr:acyl-CoA dehydrogenase family protein [Deltaproteobacteria bacterium]
MTFGDEISRDKAFGKKLAELRAWIRAEVEPHSDAWEEAQRLPESATEHLAAQGWFGAALEPQWGGLGLDGPELGRFCAELARGSFSLLSLFAVHAMVGQAIARWGDEGQKREWLPRLAAGRPLAAFALTEPERGCDAADPQCRAELEGDERRLFGEKKWISGATKAGLFLVLAACGQEGPAAFLVPADAAGLTVRPMKDLLGFRAAGVGRLRFEGCRLPASALIGRPGEGFSFVAAQALDWGRFIVAWGSVGLMEACLAASADYARQRRQFGQPLRKHQLIQGLVADLAADLAASRALAMEAARQRDESSPDSIMTACTAKYFCSKAARRAAEIAVQIHGANGCGPDYPVARYYRDAKIGEIIEGSNQMQQLMIAAEAFRS